MKQLLFWLNRMDFCFVPQILENTASQNANTNYKNYPPLSDHVLASAITLTNLLCLFAVGSGGSS